MKQTNPIMDDLKRRDAAIAMFERQVTALCLVIVGILASKGAKWAEGTDPLPLIAALVAIILISSGLVLSAVNVVKLLRSE